MDGDVECVTKATQAFERSKDSSSASSPGLFISRLTGEGGCNSSFFRMMCVCLYETIAGKIQLGKRKEKIEKN